MQLEKRIGVVVVVRCDKELNCVFVGLETDSNMKKMKQLGSGNGMSVLVVDLLLLSSLLSCWWWKLVFLSVL